MEKCGELFVIMFIIGATIFFVWRADSWDLKWTKEQVHSVILYHMIMTPPTYCIQGIQTSTPIVVTDLVEEVVQFILIMCPALEESLLYWTVSKMMR